MGRHRPRRRADEGRGPTRAGRGPPRGGAGPRPAGFLRQLSEEAPGPYVTYGFRYRVLSREGDPLRSGEGPVPSNHDGMTALPGRHGRVHLVR
ncbi:alkaline phosphatase PhoX, partial [Streptomyces bacillaris]|uniref:alkaline phosphatase PhoX n=1 Tax=Streptomyces bacillaris TaxID=68179 RepID=UPI003629835E